MKARVSEKGQVTIPKALRDRLAITSGQELEFEERQGVLLARRVVPSDPLRALVGLVKERLDVDAYLAQARGPAWNTRIDARQS